MDTNGYVAFLILGVALVAIDAAIVYRSGRAYLGEEYHNCHPAVSPPIEDTNPYSPTT